MAQGPQIKYNVTCGVLDEDTKTITLMYTIPDPEHRITWEWIHQQDEQGGRVHIAHMVAMDSNRGHRSKPIPDHLYTKLGSPKKKRQDKYYKVKMSRKDKINIEEYFNQ